MKQFNKVLALVTFLGFTATAQANNTTAFTLTEIKESAIASMNKELGEKREKNIQREAKKALTEQIAVVHTAMYLAKVSNAQTTDKVVIKGE